MKRIIKNVISVAFTAVRLFVLRIMMGSNLTTGWIERISPTVQMDFDRCSKVVLGSKVRVHSGCRIKVRKGAQLEIQAGAKMNNNCIITCRDKIVIGEGTEFGPSVYLFDHDHIHDYRTGMNDSYNTAPIIIGRHCWIGANTIILKGAKLGDYCVIAAGSVVIGEVPSGATYVQKRTATIIEPNGVNG